MCQLFIFMYEELCNFACKSIIAVAPNMFSQIIQPSVSAQT